MVIDTSRRAEKLTALKQILAIVLVVPIAIILYGPIRHHLTGLGIPVWWVVGRLIVAYMLYRLYFHVRNVYFVYVSDQDLEGAIRFRFYPLKPLQQRLSTFDLPKHELYKYEVKASKYNVRLSLTIWQQRGSQIFKFPAISLSLLTRRERQQLRALLDQYVRQRGA